MTETSQVNRRVLVIDEHPSAYLIICSALTGPYSANDSILTQAPRFDVQTALPDQALEMVAAAAASGAPYAMAFVDPGSPPHWQGAQLIEGLLKIDPDLQVVVCAGCGDVRDRIPAGLAATHQLLVLRKPFEPDEVWHLACALTQKRHAAEQTRQQQRSLEEANEKLRQEITDHKQAENQLAYNALHDPLTDLANRTLLSDRITHCMLRAKRDEKYLFALLFLDLDDFKLINDTYGHSIGDHMLTQIAGRLRQSLRAMDTASRPGEDVAARLGGDEFVILLDDVRSRDSVMMVANRVMKALAAPFSIAGSDLHVRLSMGVAFYEEHYCVAEDMLRDADAALYYVKARGKGFITVFNDEMRQQSVTRLRLGNDIRRAVEDHEMRLLYQPIMSLSTGRIECFEALVRWNHPERGMMSPAEFIPIAEETGYAAELGYWVLREACQQLRLWHDAHPDHADLTVSVNFSARQLTDEPVLERIDAILSQTGLQPCQLNIEVTESTVIESSGIVGGVIAALHDRGIGLHLDDFGTGYSSLSCLHQLPFNAIKMDRAFIREMNLDGRHANIVQAIQTMASNRRMKVIAEGIERAEQLVQLQTLDCDSGQGYFLSLPVEARQAEALLLAPPMHTQKTA